MSTIRDETTEYLCLDLAGTLMSPNEFDNVDDWDEDYTYELIHGVLVVSPPVDSGERGSNETLGYLLLTYQETHPNGASLDLTLPESYIHTPDSRRRADRAIWAGLGRMPDVRRKAPNIAVEFVSAGKRDRLRDYVEKRNEYMAVGLDEYWIIDRFRRTMTVVRRDQADRVVAENEVYETPLLPGFELPLGRILAIADAIKGAESPDGSGE